MAILIDLEGPLADTRTVIWLPVVTVINEQIDTFTSYFRDQIRDIGKLHDGLHTRILWVTLLDALSQVAFPSLRRKNRERITRFLEHSAAWDIANRCSLPQVKLNLEHKQLVSGKLYEFARSELGKWDKGSVYRPHHEPEDSAYANLAYCDCERRILRICRFKELFYSYRNWLVHGFKIPGYGMEISSNQKEAHYHSSEDKGVLTWELVFPPLLFQRLVSSGLDNLENELRQKQRNPYDAVEFGSRW